MHKSIKLLVACGCYAAIFVVTAACAPRQHRTPPVAVSDLMEDQVALDGVLMKCNQNPAKARSDADCLNARIAIERLAVANDNEPAREAKRIEDFERSREQLRMLQEKQRQDQEAKTKIDVYHLPVMPVDPASSPKDPQSPIVGKTGI